jgi:16S rRNA (cytidine1402-2'-O)-methyltransferase
VTELPEIGTLYMVATPLGNMEDMTFRAVRVLKEAALIAAEDTRRTRKILNRHGLATRLISYREQNHKKVMPRILAELREGHDVALVTDAGTPGVSDPGRELARDARNIGARVIPVPGPSAVASAMSVAGLPADSYLFAGFLPSRRKARQDALEALKDVTHTLVFFEAPHRLADTLKDTAEILGDRETVICREMTKLNEEYTHGNLIELAADTGAGESPVKGEITLVVAGAGKPDRPLLGPDEIVKLVSGDDRPVREIVAELAGITGLSRSELYRLVLKATNRDR